MVQKSVIVAVILMTAFFTSLETSPHAYCPADTTPEFASTKVQTAALQQFDFISYFLGSNKDSLPILVRFGDATNPFRMKHMKVDGTYSAASMCDGSENHEFVDMRNHVLILKTKTATPVFKICVYAQADATMVQIAQSTDVTSGGSDAYKSVNAIGIISSGSNSRIRLMVTTFSNQMAIVVNGISDGSVRLTYYTVGQTFDQTNPIHQTLAFDKAGSFKSFITSWVDQSAIPAADITGKTIRTFPQINRNAVITLTDSATEHTGLVYTVSGSTVTKADSFTISAPRTDPIKFRYFSDHLYNFARVSVGQLAWITITTDSQFWKSLVTIETANLFSVGFSRNKAMLIYTTGAMTVLEHKGDGSVITAFQNKMITGSLELDQVNVEAGNQFIIKFSCLCRRVNAFVCFSETLNCVILNKAKQSCGLTADIENTWTAS